MNLIYNSDNYCVVEFQLAGQDHDATRDPDQARAGHMRVAFEIVDKTARREIFLNGVLAEQFRQGVAQLVASGPTVETIDTYLSQFEPLMQQKVVLH